MAHTDTLTFWARHHHKLGCNSAAPKDGNFAFSEDWRLSKFRIVDVGYAQLLCCIETLGPVNWKTQSYESDIPMRSALHEFQGMVE